MRSANQTNFANVQNLRFRSTCLPYAVEYIRARVERCPNYSYRSDPYPPYTKASDPATPSLRRATSEVRICTKQEKRLRPGRLARMEGLLEEDHGLGIVADVPTLPGAPHELSELGVAGGWFTVLDKPERVADVQDAFFENEAGETCGRRLPCRYDLCELGGGKATVEEYRLLKRRSDGSIGVYSAYHTALRIHLPQRPQGTNSRHDPLLLGPSEELFTLGEPRLDEIAALGLRLRNFDFLDEVERLPQTQLL
jgi:hypothetical protein